MDSSEPLIARRNKSEKESRRREGRRLREKREEGFSYGVQLGTSPTAVTVDMFYITARPLEERCFYLPISCESRNGNVMTPHHTNQCKRFPNQRNRDSSRYNGERRESAVPQGGSHVGYQTRIEGLAQEKAFLRAAETTMDALGRTNPR